MTLVTGESLRGRAGWDRGGLVGRGLRLCDGSLAGHRIWLRVGLRGSGSACEHAREQARPAQARIGAVRGDAVRGGSVIAQRAGGEVLLFVVDRIGAGGVALATQVVAVRADGGSLAAGLRQPAAGV